MHHIIDESAGYAIFSQPPTRKLVTKIHVSLCFLCKLQIHPNCTFYLLSSALRPPTFQYLQDKTGNTYRKYFNGIHKDNITKTHNYNIHNDDTLQLSLDSRPRRERRPGIPCRRMREIINSNFIIQIEKNGQSYKRKNTYDNVTTMAAFRDTNQSRIIMLQQCCFF